MIFFHLFRHAESTGNVNNHIIGGRSSHLPLTERGEQQAHLLGKRLQQEGFTLDKVYCSDAIRAKETARIATSYIGWEPQSFIEDPAIAELSQGKWEGLHRLAMFNEETKKQFLADPLEFRAPEGESQAQARIRLKNWLDKALEEAEEGQVIGAFSHGFAIRSIVGHLLRADGMFARQVVTYNTSITTLYFHKDNWYFDRINDHAHLHGTEFIGHY
ncbi:MAG: histidine phosphatase family protein [Bacteroidota bacterium]